MNRKSLNVLILISLTLFAWGSIIFASSLWPQGSKTPYGSSSAHKIGDIITILIIEKTQASQSTDTNTKKNTGVDGSFLLSWDRLASALKDQTNMKGKINYNDSYYGGGNTSRKSLITAQISAIVTKVLSNGNLYIKGQREVTINDEKQTVIVDGIIRPEDITAYNTIESTQIANANIAISGIGPASAKQSPGIISRLFNWLF